MLKGDRPLVKLLSEFALHIACEDGRMEEVADLLDRGVDVNADVEWGETPLLCAAWNDHWDLVRHLLEREADLRGESRLDSSSPLNLAAEVGQLDIANLLLERGAYIDHSDDQGMTPLISAFAKGDERMARLLLDNGAGPNCRGSWGHSPLETVSFKSAALVKLLLERGAKIALPELIRAHSLSKKNREALPASRLCGCFHCLRVFLPGEIRDWTDSDETAICPYCGIEAVLGNASGVPMIREFLVIMRSYWSSQKERMPD